MAANQLSQRPGIEVAILWMVKVGRNRQGAKDQPKVKLSTLDRPKSKTWHAPTGISCISTNWHFFIFPLQRDNNRSYIVVSLQPKPLDINKMFGRSFP
jgi:hypothetical protein